MTEAAPGDGVLSDVCEVDFPPASYGETLEEVEATVQQVVERVFRDEDGLVRSGVYGKTMRPLMLEEVRDRPHGIGCYSENHAMPNRYKPIYNNYENAGQASGKYIRAMLKKYRATGDPAVLGRARQTVRALELLWNNVAEQNPYGRGWLPKPFGGARDVSEMFECSPDQYADVTLGLDRYHDEAADADERLMIERMVASFADWWLEHDYTTSYQGACCWWKRTDFPHATAFFLYLNALAYRVRPQARYAEAFDLWLGLQDGLFNCPRVGVNASGLAIECMERLTALRPDLEPLWRRAAEANTAHMIELAERSDNYPGLSATFNYRAYLAHHLGGAHRLFPDRGHDRHMASLIAAYRSRTDFYHLRRGALLAELSPVVAGDDYRNMFWAEGHVCWLSAYWALRQPAA